MFLVSLRLWRKLLISLGSCFEMGWPATLLTMEAANIVLQLFEFCCSLLKRNVIDSPPPVHLSPASNSSSSSYSVVQRSEKSIFVCRSGNINKEIGGPNVRCPSVQMPKCPNVQMSKCPNAQSLTVQTSGFSFSPSIEARFSRSNSIHYTLYNVHRTLYRVYSVHSIVYGVQFTV